MSLILGPLFDFGAKLIDRLIPDPAQKAQAQLDLLKMQQQGELDAMKTQLSAILAEAQSPDKWTSRARPSFLYVMYLLLLWGIPMGIVSAFSIQTAQNIGAGFGAWLHAIPDPMWALMTAGYLGYAVNRSVDKYNEGKSK